MEKFAAFIQQLETSNKTNDKIDAIVQYLNVAPEEDKIWLLALFTGKRPKRSINTALLKEWATAIAGIPAWPPPGSQGAHQGPKLPEYGRQAFARGRL